MRAREIITYMESLQNEQQRKILMGFFVKHRDGFMFHPMKRYDSRNEKVKNGG